MIDLRSVEAFVVLAETLNFRVAAERMAMSQPALSVRLKRFEDELGMALLVRSRNAVRLSKEGATFQPYAQRLLDQGHGVREIARDIAEGRAGLLRIGYTPVSFYAYVPALIRSHALAHPGVTTRLVECLSSDIERGITSGDLDAGFLHPPIDQPGLTLTPLPSERYVLAMTADDPLSTFERIDVRQLAERDLILVSRCIGPHLHDRIVAACLAAGFSPCIAQEVMTSTGIMGLVAAGHGVGLVIAALAQVGRSDVVFREIDGIALELPFALAARAGESSSIVTCFVRHVAEEALEAAIHNVRG